MSVSDPGNQQPEHSGEQAEVATIAASALHVVGGQVVRTQNIVAAYRYTGTHPLPQPLAGPDIEYGAPSGTGTSRDVTIHRGASMAGWAFSNDSGIAWTAPGKIYPNSMTQFGDHASALWGDPSLAVGYVHPSLVAYAALGVSDQAFAQAAGSDGSIHHWLSLASLPQGATSSIDSACVALSFNGGQNWNQLYCKRPDGIGQEGTDQTATGIDKNDNIFFATTDATLGALLIYQVLYFSTNTGPVFFGFSQLTIAPEMADSAFTPRIARDQDGELWLAAGSQGTGTSPPTVRLCHITAGSISSSGSCDFVGQVTTSALAFPRATSTSIGDVRTGETVSFGVNRVLPPSSGGPRQLVPYTDFFFAYHTGPLSSLQVGVTACRLPTIGGFACKDVPQWGSSNVAFSPKGQQFQPTISVTDMSSDQRGGGEVVRYAFYEFDSKPEVPSGHVEVVQAKLSGSPFGGAPPTVTFEPLVGAPPPAVCTAKYAPPSASANEYWGDYFGYMFLPPAAPGVFPRYLSVYSSDEGNGCVTPQANDFQGRELHLQSWFWLD